MTEPVIKGEEKARELLKRGQLLEAIKLIRNENHLDLLMAKRIVERWRETQTPEEQAAGSEAFAEETIRRALLSVKPERRDAILKSAVQFVNVVRPLSKS